MAGNLSPITLKIKLVSFFVVGIFAVFFVLVFFLFVKMSFLKEVVIYCQRKPLSVLSLLTAVIFIMHNSVQPTHMHCLMHFLSKAHTAIAYGMCLLIIINTCHTFN